MSHDQHASLYAKRARTMNASSIREICKLISRPEIISLAGGWPSPNTFPNERFSNVFEHVMRNQSNLALQYTTTEGLPKLREAISAMESRRCKRTLSPDEIIITHGSTQGIDLATKVLLDPGDILLVELPTYFGGPGSADALDARQLGVLTDDHGLSIEALTQTLNALSKEELIKTKAIYTIPDFHNPTGTCMPLERRKQLLQLAEEFDFLIIEDAPYIELRYDGERIPTLFELDASGRVIHLRSFSKIFTPGMRLGWMYAEPGILRKMVIQKQYVDACTNTLGQYMLLEFIERGWLLDQIAANIGYYRNMRDITLQSLDTHFSRELTRWNRPEGGFFVFVHLPKTMSADELFHRALERNVAFVSGAPFFIDGSGQNTFRISFSQISPETLQTAAARLGELILSAKNSVL